MIPMMNMGSARLPALMDMGPILMPWLISTIDSEIANR
jgi:hypothetical protein